MNLHAKYKKYGYKQIFNNLILMLSLILGIAIGSYAQGGSGEISTKSASVPKSGKVKKKTNKTTSNSRNSLKAMVTSIRANFRVYPSNYAVSLGTVTYGEVLLVLDKNHVNGWYNVKHMPTNITGWVYGNTITLMK